MIHARPDYDGRFVDLGPNGDASKAIPSDEPVLLLRGQDKAAPAAAEAWAAENDRLGGDARLSAAVRLHARRIVGYQENTGRSKLSDLPEGMVVADDGLIERPDATPAPTPMEG